VLFDLQSPRRKRAVRIIFGSLAGIFAVSFVALGVGTGGSGFSLSDLFGGGGGGSQSSAFDGQIKAAEKQLAVNPNDTTALANLVQYHYQAASGNVDSSGRISSDGVDHLREAADSWNKYVKVAGGNIQTPTALFALNAFDQLGTVDFQKARTETSTADALRDANAAVDDWKTAAQAQQVLIQQQPKTPANSYARLASYYYLSGDTPAGDQAVAQAKQAGGKGASSFESQLKQIQQLGQSLQAAIKQLTKQQQQTSQGATGGGNPLGGISGSGGLGGAGTGGGPLSAP
jgi:hypothetical protein